jgi:hypothetical protein
VNRYAPPRERQRDPPGADAELERTPGADAIREEIDDGIDHARIEDLGIVIVGRGEPLVEIAVVVHDQVISVDSAQVAPGRTRRAVGPQWRASA